MSDNQAVNNELEVAILLSTFNGGKYLNELLDSLISQNYKKTKIYIRDDGSTDETLEVIGTFLSDDVVLLSDDLGNIKTARSFFQLLSVARADIYMFCDQDDIWLPDKVRSAVEAIARHGATMPLLYHTDLVLVDNELNKIANSFNLHEGIRMPAAHRLTHLIVQNCVVGCTAAITDKLVEVSRLRSIDLPQESIAMHDWWLALCGRCFGEIVFSTHSFILYRQHENNVSGVTKTSFLKKILLQFSVAGLSRINKYKNKVATQAAAFDKFYSGAISEECSRDLRAVASLNQGTGLRGVLFCLRRGIRLQNLYMNISIAFTSLVYLFKNK